MGYIKEPKGVDFVIESSPLTAEERVLISEFIRKDKMRAKSGSKKNRPSKLITGKVKPLSMATIDAIKHKSRG